MVRINKGLFAAVAVLLATGGALSVARAPLSSAEPKPANGLRVGLQDQKDGSYAMLQLDRTSTGYGTFAFSLPGTGLVWAKAPGDVAVDGMTTHVSYDGDGYRDAGATLDPEFGVNYRLSGSSTPVHVRVVSSVDINHHTGVVNVWLDGKHLTINGTQTKVSPRSVADKYVAAVLAHDADALYSLSDSDLRAAVSRADFVADMSRGDQLTGITQASVSGSGTVTTNDAGVTYATFPLSLTKGGQTQNGTMILILEQGAWRFFTVRP